MSTILTIAHREYTAMIATKAFLVTLVLMPVLMLGGLFVIPLVSQMEGSKARKIVVADASGKLLETLQAAAQQRNQVILAANANDERGDASGGDMGSSLEGPGDTYMIEATEQAPLSSEDRIHLSDQIRSGEIYAMVEIPAEVDDPTADAEARKVRFVSNSGTLSDVRGWVGGVLNNTLRVTRLQELGIDPQLVAAADQPVQVAAMRPYRASKDETNADGGVKEEAGEEESLATVFAPFLMMMLMFVVIFLAAQPMLESSMEEKTHRISEVLLGAVTPTQMMAGKLLGNVAGSMIIFLLYGIGGLFMLYRYEMLHLLPMHLLAWFLVFQIAAVLLYSSIFMTVGAAVSQLKEAQSLLLPVWLVMAAPMMIWVIALRDPNGAIATGMSFFPPSAPLMMILRLGTGAAVPMWQPPLSAALLLLSAAGVIVIAGRIYRASLLRGEGARSLLQLLRRAA